MALRPFPVYAEGDGTIEPPGSTVVQTGEDSLGSHTEAVFEEDMVPATDPCEAASEQVGSAPTEQANPELSAAETTDSQPAQTEGETTATQPTEDSATVTSEQSSVDDSAVYENGIIKIYNLSQLNAIGTGQPVTAKDSLEHEFGQGTPVLDRETPITYGLDGQYMLMNDIPLDTGHLWTLPEHFTGSFQAAPAAENPPLYDESTDTISVFHNYQLLTISGEDSETEPVMSGDAIASDFGMGTLVYPGGTPANDSPDAAQQYLTYSKQHRYVLSSTFTEQMPPLKAQEVRLGTTTVDQKGGRVHVGQVYTEINGEKYILIGNEQQLRAIGTDQQVAPMLFLRTQFKLLGIPLSHKLIPYYPGDADFNLSNIDETDVRYSDIEQKTRAFQYMAQNPRPTKLMNPNWGDPDGLLSAVVGIVGGVLSGVVDLLFGGQEIVGLKEEGTPNVSIGSGRREYKTFRELEQEYKNLKYSSTSNYIIFRDIDLSSTGTFSNGQDDPWKPILLTGSMEGRLNMVEGAAPTISNVQIQTQGALDLEKDSGVGFFGTIGNQYVHDASGTMLQSKGTTVVRDLNLSRVTVNNGFTKVDKTPDSLVEGLLGLLGGLLGGIIGGITALLPIIGNLNLGQVIKELLTLKQGSPDIFATGSFAGRIVGDVRVENCTVTDASVTSLKGMVGGFVGYTEGEAQYGPISGLAGDLVKILSTLLNLIPGVGLGDLITILLQNDVPLGQLVPIGYHNPTMTGCSVSMANGTIGSSTVDYTGGFVGVQTGTKIDHCSVSGLQQVEAKVGAGGFAGIERDAVLKGLLNDLGVDVSMVDISSAQTDCLVNSTVLRVSAADCYAGGFNGIMADGSSTNCTVTGLQSVAAGKYAGGFAGRATIGYGLAVGGEDEKRKTLLESVSKLLSKLLASGNDAKVNVLLSLSGAQPSKLQNCSVQGSSLGVTSTLDYAGGLIGQGDGVKITGGSKVSGLSAVTAERFAGGIAGSLSTADAIGVLNNTVGVGRYIPFAVQNVSVEGNGLVVSATKKYAAGGAGLMLGGKADQVDVHGLTKVESGNYAGGFAGRAGVSGLASTGGLNVLGLVKINNVLSLADGIRVTVSNVQLNPEGTVFTVAANGNAALDDGEAIIAGGFAAEAVGISVTNAAVHGLKRVSAAHPANKGSYAGGFVGRSHTGGLAGLAQEEADGTLKLPGILEVNSLLNLLPYLLPTYTDSAVTFAPGDGLPQVEGQYAGGFVGEMQSGKVTGTGLASPVVVQGLEQVLGEAYAGGFGGRVDAGAAASTDGLKLLSGVLNLNLNNLLGVLNVYVPAIESAGVQSAEGGYTVKATDKDSSAGGFIGYGSGVQIKASNVDTLKHTRVTPPADALESADGSNYFNETRSEYAVQGGRYAGGYIGCVNIDSAAAVGGGLSLLGGAIQLGNVLDAINAVYSVIEDSSVTGSIGGFSVLADGTDVTGSTIGKAGGFAGQMSGAVIRRSHVDQFAYIIGREMAGGYVGMMEPGDVASVLDHSSILNGIVNIKDSVANLVQAFIPVVEDCQTCAVPCGGAVRADGFTDNKVVRGLAGGYAGYNHGGRIQGTHMENAVIRLRSVYGGESAGGFTGVMENADLAGTGHLEVLFGLIETSNVLSLLGAVYPTETNTATYGPLRKLDVETWNGWVDAVGKNGVYGNQFPTIPVGSQQELDALIQKYAYGYRVKAGRTAVGNQKMQTGTAGGYAGTMFGGVVTEAHAWDVMEVSAYKSAGGFAGELFTDGVAEVGKVSLLGLDLTGSIGAVQTFVPVIRNSDVTGYQSGMRVKATGLPGDPAAGTVEKAGYAGGFAGHVLGGQIWGNWTPPNARSATDAAPNPQNNRCFTANLRKVDGTNAVGGFVGLVEPGSAAALDTASSSGLLGGLLQKVIGTPGDLLSVLNATMSTLRACDVRAWDQYGIAVNGMYSDGAASTRYAKAVGGFAGEIRGAVVGTAKDQENGAHVYDLRSVTGGEHAGGFFGLADVSAVAEISGGGETSILGSLLKLGSLDVMDAFRTFIYFSDVSGTAQSGLEVHARDAKKLGYVNDPVYTGNAGGFGGTMLDGSAKDCKVTNLRTVEGMNYTGGFVGHLGKSGVVDVDSLGIFDKVASVGAGVLDVFGAHVDRSEASGIPAGFTVRSHNTLDAVDKSEICGGFVGFADLARMSDNRITNLAQVASGEIAGGYAGETTFAYLADIKLDSPVVNLLLGLVNRLLKALWVEKLEQGKLIKINLGIITVGALYDGELIHVNLLGLNIKIALAKGQHLATIYIGDSKIEVNCAPDGSITDDKELRNEVRLSLIKANRTRIDRCTVTGTETGYDVYGGGAGNDANGAGQNGYAGGFVGLNHEALMQENQMILADVIRGTEQKTGPFTGTTTLDSSYSFNTVEGIEGKGNQFRIYRSPNPALDHILGGNSQILQSAFESNADWNIYTMTHMQKGKTEKFENLSGAELQGVGSAPAELDAYMENGAMAVLMDNTPSGPAEPGPETPGGDIQDPCKDTVQLNIEKVWKKDREEIRPTEIRLYITRSYTCGGAEVQDEAFRQEVVLNQSDYLSQNVWEKVLSGIEYTAYHVAENGEKCYYTYFVTEDPLSGYKTEITYHDQYHYGVTITNEKTWFSDPLPETGGMGLRTVYVVGVMLIALYVSMELADRKRKKNVRQDRI